MPSLDDDGRTVTLDLHGATVEKAVALAEATLRAAAARGRSSVKLVHGASTSSRLYRNRTVKHAVQDLAGSEALGALVTSTFHAEGHLLCSLDVTAAHRNPAPLSLRDVF